jgi:H+-translocating NAD(P) transhydrogenase subunit alpha
MNIGIPKELNSETRVALAPETVKKLVKKGHQILVQSGAGVAAGFPDSEFTKEGARIVSRDEALKCEVVFKVNRPEPSEILTMTPGTLLAAYLEPHKDDGLFNKLAEMKINAVAMELIPRTSRAQAMDALSSQANIAGYRAVVEAATVYGSFFPMMMTAAGSAKPAKVAVLGVGVAGLQAISTAKRLGGQIEAYDIRPEVKEQIISVGAKPIELDVGEEGSGQGGYAKELSESAKAKQQQLLTEKLKKFDIIITTANIPGRKSPVLVTEDAVKGMKPGSVIVDMAAANGGNCPLTEADKITVKHGVTLVGHTNYARMMPNVASRFFGMNLFHLIGLFVDEKTQKLNLNLQDDIIAASLTTLNGEIRMKR